jgi:hypothetical protein
VFFPLRVALEEGRRQGILKGSIRVPLISCLSVLKSGV